MARRRYQRRRHLAEAINQSSPGMQKVWAAVIAIAFVVAVVAMVSH